MKPTKEELQKPEEGEQKAEREKLREREKPRRKGPAERMWAPIKLHLDEDYQYVTKNWGLRFLY